MHRELDLFINSGFITGTLLPPPSGYLMSKNPSLVRIKSARINILDIYFLTQESFELAKDIHGKI